MGRKKLPVHPVFYARNHVLPVAGQKPVKVPRFIVHGENRISHLIRCLLVHFESLGPCRSVVKGNKASVTG